MAPHSAAEDAAAGRRAGAFDGPAEETPQAFAEEAAENDDKQREHDELIAAEVAQELGGDIDQEGAADRAGKGAEAADYHHADDNAGLRKEAEFGADELCEMPVERTGKPADGGAERKGVGLPQHDLHAAARGSNLIVANGAQIKACGCAQKKIEPELDDNEHAEHHIIPSEPVVEEPRHVKAEVAARDLD